ncbi:RNF144B [Cordylochernes scorpioides]|uniref:RBR-type E3 ubiquitin transferase n=1 Tax=Cordylochernes scorpioides TaxID=51811 RepID=A0ABY6L6D5_9ARAC|nr:RNF144B [Cordylochernes scorpioides]
MCPDVRKDSSLAWCPRGGCETVCQVVPNEPVWCPTCVHVFCPQCKREWHEDKPCPRNTSIDNLLLADGSNPGEEIKACPNCHVLIERNDGCAQMMCKFCEHIFCWHCLASLDEDVFLKHFDKGPCKNKLGHSKASLMWHRARVSNTSIFLKPNSNKRQEQSAVF